MPPRMVNGFEGAVAAGAEEEEEVVVVVVEEAEGVERFFFDGIVCVYVVWVIGEGKVF